MLQHAGVTALIASLAHGARVTIVISWVYQSPQFTAHSSSSKAPAHRAGMRLSRPCALGRVLSGVE